MTNFSFLSFTISVSEKIKQMSLININKLNLNVVSIPKNKKEVENFNVEKKQNLVFHSSPISPKYWQNASGVISFKGKQTLSTEEKIAKVMSHPNISLLPEEDVERIKSILSSPKFQDYDLVVPIRNSINDFDLDEKKEIYDLLDLLDEIQDDDSKKTLFERFFDEDMFFLFLSTSKIKRFWEKDTVFINQLFDYFQTKKEARYPVFDIMFIDARLYDLLEHVNASNFEEFKLATLNENIKTSFAIADRYLNPHTRIFDKSIMDAVLALNGNEKFKDDYYWTPSSASNTVFAAVDVTTQKITPFFDEIVETFYPTTQQSDNKFTYNGMDSSFPFLIYSLKDKKGDVSKEKIDLMKQILQIIKNNNRICVINYEDLANLMFALRTPDGTQIDETKKNIAFEIIDETDCLDDAEVVVKCLGKYPTDKQGETFDVFKELNPKENFEYSALPSIIAFCSDDEDVLLTDKVEYVKKIIDAKQFTQVSNLFATLKEHPELEDFILEITPIISVWTDIDELIDAIVDLNENGELLSSEHKKEKFKDYLLKADGYIADFNYLYESCNKKTWFDDDLFGKSLQLLHISNDAIISMFDYSPSFFYDVLNGTFDISSYSYRDKLICLDALKELEEYLHSENIQGFDAVTVAISNVEDNLNCDDVVASIDKTTKFEFINKVLASNPAGCELTKFEKVLVESIPLIETMTGGLELEYSRKEFLKDLNALCDDDDTLIILSKIGITPIYTDSNITGYNGLIAIDKLDVSNPKEKAIYDLVYKFIYENKVNTKNSDLNEQLNIILKACPEFINTIGKKQHGTQKYTVDIHSLLVLAYSINNLAYNSKLKPLDKSLLKLTAIVHDLMKPEGEVDKTHQHTSANQARILGKRFFKSPNMIDRFYNLVNNHHWTEEYANALDKDYKEKELAFRFRIPNDFEIAKIMADSDIRAVNEHFYERLKHCLNSERINPIQEKIDDLYKYGNAIFTDGIISPSKLNSHLYERQGKQYRILDFNEIGEDEDMSEYGFVKGKKKKDINLLVHMVDADMPYKRLNDVKNLSSPVNGGVLSTSLISPLSKRTYLNRKFGVVLQQENTGVLNMLRENQSSGVLKELNQVLFFVFNDRYRRTLYRKNLLTHLGIDYFSVTDEQYIAFYKEHLATKNSLNEIPETKEYKIGEYSFSGLQLKTALQKIQDDLLDKDEITHNEIVCYTPKITAVIAKCANCSLIPNDVLCFAHENNLPVILI